MTIMAGSDEELARAVIAILRKHGVSLDAQIKLHVNSVLPPLPATPKPPEREAYADKLKRLQREREDRYDLSQGRQPKANAPIHPDLRYVNSGETAFAIPHILSKQSEPTFVEGLKKSLQEVHKFFSARYSPRTRTLYVVASNPRPQRIIAMAHRILRPE